MDYDAEGVELSEPCPQCGGENTVTYLYNEGFTELECRTCGFNSELEDIAELARYRGDLRERKGAKLPPIPVKKLEA